MAEREPVVTIDGPAGAGKGTVARALADRLGFRLLDTGAMYRAAALSITRAGLDVTDTAALRRHLAEREIIWVDGRVYLDDEDVTSAIRTREIDHVTSSVSTLAPVREKLTQAQRRLAAGGGVILEGRDTGTVVCPDAEVKFYLTASLETRAQRRQAEFRARGLDARLPDVVEEIRSRDRQDETRALAPLCKAADAIEVDTTSLAVDEVVEMMLTTIERRRCCTRS